MQDGKTKKEKKNEGKENAESSSDKLLVLPYVQGLSETTARIMRKHGRTCALKPMNTLRQRIFRLKDKADSMKMVDMICKVQCKDCLS